MRRRWVRILLAIAIGVLVTAVTAAAAVSVQVGLGARARILAEHTVAVLSAGPKHRYGRSPDL